MNPNPKIFVITTSVEIPINLPSFVEQEKGRDVTYVVAGDKKTPHYAVSEFLYALGSKVEYLTPEYQEMRWPTLSKIIGWNTVSRRNFALLFAIHAGADVVVTVDGDNFAEPNYFDQVMVSLGAERRVFVRPEDYLDEYNNIGLFNPGRLCEKPHYVRGFPYTLRGMPFSKEEPDLYESFNPYETMILTGYILKDPDINATERLESNPYVHQVYQIPLHLFYGTYTPINTQNTAFFPSVASAFLLSHKAGRYDDIFAGWLAQMLAHRLGGCVTYGGLTAKQNRFSHNLIKDLHNELYGMQHTEEFIDVALSFFAETERDFSSNDPLAIMDIIYSKLFMTKFSEIYPKELTNEWIEALRSS